MPVEVDKDFNIKFISALVVFEWNFKELIRSPVSLFKSFTLTYNQVIKASKLQINFFEIHLYILPSS